MQHIAEECEVSKMAVSLALRDHPSVPEQTRRRIKESAQKLGYKSNPYLSQLMAQIRTVQDRRKCLSAAFLNHFPLSFLKNSADASRHFYIGAMDRARERGFVVYELSRPHTKSEQKAQRNKLVNMGVDGAIIFPFEEPSGARQLDWEKYPVVTLGYTFSGAECHRICCDYFRNARIVISELAKRGRRRVGYVTQPSIHTRTLGRSTGGWLSTSYDRADMKIIAPLMMTDFSADRVVEYIERNKCDALAYFGNFPMADVLKYKFCIPKDLSVVSCALGDADMRAQIAGLDEQTELVGRRAFDYLEALITSHSKGAVLCPNELLVPGKWEGGWSL